MAADNRESSFVRQVSVCLSRCQRAFINENGWKLIISMGLIMLLISTVTGEDLFVTDDATRNGSFALVCAEGMLSFVEALLAAIIIWAVNRDHFIESGVILPPVIELFICFFLIIFASDIFAMMISSVVTNENMAMTAMPFALIVQMIFAGVVFELKGITEKISYATISRWGMNGLCAIADYNQMSFLSYIKEWESTPENVIRIWAVLLGFVILNGVLSWIALLWVDRY